MRRPSKPWYSVHNDTWYVCLNGQQIPLTKGKANKQEADRAFHRLMAGETPHILRPAATRIIAILDLFLEHSHRRNSRRTFEWYRDFLRDFAEKFGMLRVEELKPFHVSRWLDGHPDWDGARWGAITALKRAFNWATDEGLIRDNPIKKVKKPAMRTRSRFLTPDERCSILACYREGDPFRDFLFAMEQTGCRPGEVAVVTADHVHLDNGVWVFDEHKTQSKTGEPRVVILTPPLPCSTRDAFRNSSRSAFLTRIVPRPRPNRWWASRTFAHSS